MKKQRWRKKIPKMKNYPCGSCGEKTKVPQDYEVKYCCSSEECGCCGFPSNPVFCDKCWAYLS